MTHVEMHPAAQEELEEAFNYYLTIDEELARSFDEHYQQHLRRIGENPLLYQVRHGIVRQAILTPRFGEYSIAYTIRNTTVVILAVSHARRRPYYWNARIGMAAKMQ